MDIERDHTAWHAEFIDACALPGRPAYAGFIAGIDLKIEIGCTDDPSTQ